MAAARRRGQRGQSAAELAVLLPVLLLLVLGLLQAVHLVYAAAVARFAAFAALRAAAVAYGPVRWEIATATAREAAEAAPGVGFDQAALQASALDEVPDPDAGSEEDRRAVQALRDNLRAAFGEGRSLWRETTMEGRAQCAIRVIVPRITPFGRSLGRMAVGRCALPMEPAW